MALKLKHVIISAYKYLTFFHMNTLFIKALLILTFGIGIFISLLFYYQKYHNQLEIARESTKNTPLEVNKPQNTNNPSETNTEIPNSNIITDANILNSETKITAAKQVATSTKFSYPLHTSITATVFWVGEPQGGGSSEDNALSAWDDSWQKHYGCFDDPSNRNGYHPKGCTPKENPFYFDLPYDDFDWDGADGRRSGAHQVIPWAKSKKWQDDESMLKNQWIKITKENAVCYAQWEDAGPYVYDDARYVFGKKDERPKSKEANNAGMDVSPAVRDCLKFKGLNNDTNKVTWQFVEFEDVPAGPWKDIITNSSTYWK